MSDKDGGSDYGPMLEYGDQALALQERMFNENKQMSQPWLAAGQSGLNELMIRMGLSPSGSSASRQSLVDQYKPQFTTSSPSTNSNMLVGPDGRVYSGSNQQDIWSQYVGNNPNDYRPWNTDTLQGSGWKSVGPESTSTTDTAGLNSFIDNLLAKNQATAENDPNYGSLLDTFDASKMYDDPGYQFRLDQGNKGLERQLAASGKYFSPDAAKAVSEYNQGFASNEYGNSYNRFNNDQNNIFNRLASISGLGQTAAGQISNAGTNYANAGSDLLTGMGNTIVAGNQAQAANRGSMFNNIVGMGLGAASLFGTGGASSALSFGPGGATYMLSDPSAKENIKKMGEKNGFNIYRFNYKGDDRLFEGVMADEVDEVMPEAVAIFDGYMAVNYPMIGIEFKEVKTWH